jgi:hypothetical protein
MTLNMYSPQVIHDFVRAKHIWRRAVTMRRMGETGRHSKPNTAMTPVWLAYTRAAVVAGAAAAATTPIKMTTVAMAFSV